jgi:F-type H+-transporting ATPase subunit epsilon
MLQCRIWGDGAPIFTGPAHGLLVPAESGKIGILPGHISLMATVLPGIVHIFHEEKAVSIEIASGVLLIEGDQVTLVTSYASIREIVDECMANWIPIRSH